MADKTLKQYGKTKILPKTGQTSQTQYKCTTSYGGAGTGCTVGINADSAGSITDLVKVDVGSGYSENDILNVIDLFGNGAGGQAKVLIVGGSGEANSVTLENDGAGYFGYDDGYYQPGNPASPRLVDNHDGTVSDKATGLTWIRDVSMMLPGATGVGEVQPLWVTSHLYHVGDRVFVTGDQMYDCLIEHTSDVFSEDFDDGDWAILGGGSGVYSNNANEMQDTRGDWATETAYKKADLVKDAVASPNSFWVCCVAHTSGVGTFDDDRTAHPTYWRQNVWVSSAGSGFQSNAMMTWQNAIINAHSLEFVGHTDWRVPNVTEFMSIFNNGGGSVLSPIVILDAKNWTSTSAGSLSDPKLVATVFSAVHGTVTVNESKANSWYVPLVRGGR